MLEIIMEDDAVHSKNDL